MTTSGAHAQALRPAHATRRTIGPIWGTVGIVVLVLIVMEVLSLRTDLIPHPLAVASAFVTLASQTDIYGDCVATFSAVLVGLGLACVVGLIAGIWLGTSSFWHHALNDVVLAVYAMPKIILFPIFLFAFGLGLNAEAATAFLFAVFPLLTNTEAGVRQINPIYAKVARMMDTSRWQRFRLIYLPAALPSILVGLRLAFSLALIGGILSELFASDQGLGNAIMQFYSFQELPQMYALIAFLFCVAIAGNLVIWSVERRLSRGREVPVDLA